MLNNLTPNYHLRMATANQPVLEQYYIGMHPLHTFVSDEQLKDPELQKMIAIHNVCRVVVNECVGYLMNGYISVSSRNPAIQEWADAFLESRIRPALEAIVIYQSLFGEGYAYLWPDVEGLDKGLKIRVIPPVEQGVQRIHAKYKGQDVYELTEATLFYNTFEIGDRNYREHKVELTRQSIILFEKSAVGLNDWARTMTFENPLAGVDTIPVVPVDNGHSGSDLIDVLPLQDMLNRIVYDLNVARGYHSFPMLYTEAHEVEDNLKIGPRQILWGGKYGRIEASDLSGLLAQKADTIQTISLIARSVALADRGNFHFSAKALEYLQEQFEAKLEAKSTNLRRFIKQLIHLAGFYISRNGDLYAAEVKGLETPPSWLELQDFDLTVDFNPRIPAKEKRQSDQALELYREGALDLHTLLSESGYPEPDKIIEKLIEESMMKSYKVRVELAEVAERIGIKREKIAEMLGFEASDLDQSASRTMEDDLNITGLTDDQQADVEAYFSVPETNVPVEQRNLLPNNGGNAPSSIQG